MTARAFSVNRARLADSAAYPARWLRHLNLFLSITALDAATGILFGFMSARRAAGLDPIKALRHD